MTTSIREPETTQEKCDLLCIARGMLAENLPLGVIAMETGLSEEEIANYM